eukprot:10337962-Ditylum_brightwellii.AAC.1
MEIKQHQQTLHIMLQALSTQDRKTDGKNLVYEWGAQPSHVTYRNNETGSIPVPDFLSPGSPPRNIEVSPPPQGAMT